MQDVLNGGKWLSVTLALAACSPTRHVTTSRAELLSRPIFKNSFRAVALAESSGAGAGGDDACSQAIDPLIKQAQDGLQGLNQSVAGSNSALSAATGGDPAMMAAMMLAASQAMNGQKSSGDDSQSAAPVGAPTVTDTTTAAAASNSPTSTATATAAGSGGNGNFVGPGHSEPNNGGNVAINPPGGSREPTTTPGPTPRGSDSTSIGAAAGPVGGSSPLGNGTRAGGTDSINVTTGNNPPDKISLTPASVDKEGESGGFAGYGAGHAAGGVEGSALAASLARRYAAGRTPGSLAPPPAAVRSFGTHADIATRFSPDVFRLVSTSYVNYCRINRLPVGGI